MLSFPPGFRWGTATSAYQIEGAVHADGRGPSIWDTFAHTPGKVRNGDTGDVACDHYHRYPEEVALLAELGVTAYRFSVAWPRIQPEGYGPVNQRGVDFYQRLVDTLLAHGITPVPTLYHWDLPQALEDAGGWRHRDTAYRMADYAAALNRALGDRVTTWITLNEPRCAALNGYSRGRHAPGVQDPPGALRAGHHMLLAHGLSVPALRAERPGAEVGVTLDFQPTFPRSADPADEDAADRVDILLNRLFLDPVVQGRYPDDVRAYVARVAGAGHIQPGDETTIGVPVDFLGANYYSSAEVGVAPEGPLPGPVAWPGAEDVRTFSRGLPRTGAGWEVHPDGFRALLARLHRDAPGVPLLITENGAAYPDAPDPADGAVHDPDRVAYLDAHLRAVHDAIADGVDIRGYFLWSLLDNFEWAEGYDLRFGIVHVDYDTQRRTVKDSGWWYRDVIRAHGLERAHSPEGAQRDRSDGG